MNGYRKGAAREYRAMLMLEALGYHVIRAAGSHGTFDLVAFTAVDFRLIQVKAGNRGCSPAEREQLALVPVPDNTSKEIWRFPDRCRAPKIERL
jgi:Holliday junction resolvase